MTRQYVAIKKRNWEAIIGTIFLAAATLFCVWRVMYFLPIAINNLENMERSILYSIMGLILFSFTCILASISSEEKYERYYVRTEGR